jgi:hypothetical protein
MVAVRMADENDLDNLTARLSSHFGMPIRQSARQSMPSVQEKSVAAAPTRTPAANPKSVPHLNQSKAQETVMPASGVSLMSKAKGDF